MNGSGADCLLEPAMGANALSNLRLSQFLPVFLLPHVESESNQLFPRVSFN